MWMSTIFEYANYVMNINAIALGLLAVVLGWYTYQAFLLRDKPPPSQLPWVPIDVNKRRSFVNQTRDAGMFTELTRRISNRTWNPQQKGFTNGIMDAMITGICAVCPISFVPCDENPIEDGGNAFTESCNVFDGDGSAGLGELIDFGDAETNICPT